MNDFTPITISIKEAALIMGIGRDTMYSLVKQPGFPSVKIGNKYVIRKQGLDDWLKEHQGKEIIL